MKALTLWQPWAHIVAAGIKRIENRTWWRESIRGQRIAIHAGKVFDKEAADRIHYELGGPLFLACDVALGAVIATAVVASVVDHANAAAARAGGDQAQWFVGPFGWVLERIEPCDPVSCRGRQGLWTLPEDVERAMRGAQTLRLAAEVRAGGIGDVQLLGSADSGTDRRSARDTEDQNRRVSVPKWQGVTSPEAWSPPFSPPSKPKDAPDQLELPLSKPREYK